MSVNKRSHPSSMLGDTTFADCEIVCGDQTLRAHKAILAAQSDYFKGAFSSPLREGLSSRIQIDSIDSRVLSMVLECIYAGSYKLPGHDLTFSKIAWHTLTFMAGDYLQSALVCKQALENLKMLPYSNLLADEITEPTALLLDNGAEDSCKDLYAWFIELAEDDSSNVDYGGEHVPHIAAAAKDIPGLVESATAHAYKEIVYRKDEMDDDLREAHEETSDICDWRRKNVVYCRSCCVGYLADVNKVTGGVDNAYCLLCGQQQLLKRDAGAQQWFDQHAGRYSGFEEVERDRQAGRPGVLDDSDESEG